MRDSEPVERLIDQIARSTGLSAGEAARVVADVVEYFSETSEEFVRRRHREMQTYGARNDEIFARIRDELGRRPVRAPEPTLRQLRRVIYG